MSNQQHEQNNNQHVTNQLEKNGLYAGNIILELIPDSKGVKPAFKVNNLATTGEIENVLDTFKVLCAQVHKIIKDSELPITYELAIEEAKNKITKEKEKEDKKEVKI